MPKASKKVPTSFRRDPNFLFFPQLPKRGVILLAIICALSGCVFPPPLSTSVSPSNSEPAPASAPKPAPTPEPPPAPPLKEKLKLAETLFESGEYAEAEKEYREILEGPAPEPVAAEAQYRLAFILSYYKNPQRNYASSIKEYQRAISRFPASPHRPEAENMISLLSSIASQEAETKQMKEDLQKLQQLEIEAEERRTRPLPD
jgi:tetratricopeptide (TPR) repeat protein